MHYVWKHYRRRTGVECDEVELFNDPARAKMMIELMSLSGLGWYWMSERRYDSSKRHAAMNLPARRPWTSLVADNADLLLAELTEEDGNDDRRYSALIASNHVLTTALTSQSDMARLIAAFIADQPPLVMMITTLGDTGSSFVFTARNPPSELESLRHFIGFMDRTPSETVPYSRLRTASLEAQFGIK